MAPGGAWMASALPRTTRAAAAISVTVSPRWRRAIKNAPTWLGVAAPDMIASNAAVASSSLSSSPRASGSMKGRRSVIAAAALRVQ